MGKRYEKTYELSLIGNTVILHNPGYNCYNKDNLKLMLMFLNLHDINGNPRRRRDDQAS